MLETMVLEELLELVNCRHESAREIDGCTVWCGACGAVKVPLGTAADWLVPVKVAIWKRRLEREAKSSEKNDAVTPDVTAGVHPALAFGLTPEERFERMRQLELPVSLEEFRSRKKPKL